MNQTISKSGEHREMYRCNI